MRLATNLLVGRHQHDSEHPVYRKKHYKELAALTLTLFPGEAFDAKNPLKDSRYKCKSLRDKVTALTANATRIPVKVTPSSAVKIDITLEKRRSGRKSP